MKKTAVVIENLQPLLDCGRYAIKRLAGDPVRVSADIFKDGHDVLAAVVEVAPGRRAPLAGGADAAGGQRRVVRVLHGHGDRGLRIHGGGVARRV